MREIKFRAWHHEGVAENQPMTMTYWKLGTGMDNRQFYKHAKAVMQYTGLKDKNSVEIYEGDVLQWTFCEYHREFVLVTEVKWLHSGFGLEPITCDSYEVIGNIYENPELLKEEK